MGGGGGHADAPERKQGRVKAGSTASGSGALRNLIPQGSIKRLAGGGDFASPC